MRYFTRLTAAVGLLFGVATLGLSQDQKKAPADDESKGAMPGPTHQQLAKRAGLYATTTHFKPSADVPAIESTGSVKLSSVLGGRFLSEETLGKTPGAPITGIRLWGYNNGSKQYEAMWTYTGSTAIMTMFGKSKDDGKTVEYQAAFDDEAGEKMKLRVVTRQVDNDHFTVELIAKAADGTDGPAFKTTYARQK